MLLIIFFENNWYEYDSLYWNRWPNFEINWNTRLLFIITKKLKKISVIIDLMIIYVNIYSS